ncbi:MAG: AAA family ATPase, partial [Alloprevotella sp.]
YQRHNALNRVMEDANYGISSALVLSGGNLSQSGDILYAPIYMLMFLNKGNDAPIIYNIDL